jgi:hypothetical protein
VMNMNERFLREAAKLEKVWGKDQKAYFEKYSRGQTAVLLE